MERLGPYQGQRLNAAPKSYRSEAFFPLWRAKGFYFSCAEEEAMKKHVLNPLLAILVMISALALFAGCDSGEKARDELTGNRAVKQYHQSTKNIEKIVDRQTEKHKGIPDDEKQDSKSE
jgi:hypothetical protein